MSFLYTPSTQKLHVLSKPRQYDRGGQFSPISLTEKFEESVIQKSWKKVTEDSLLFRLTDGAWELFPHSIEKISDPLKKRNFLEYTPDIEKMEQILSLVHETNPSANPRDFRMSLSHLLQKTLKERKDKLTLYQQVTGSKLQLFLSLGKGKTIKDFITWNEEKDKSFAELFLNCINYLNLDLERLYDVPVEDYKVSLQSIQFGDDMTLHVESVLVHPPPAQIVAQKNPLPLPPRKTLAAPPVRPVKPPPETDPGQPSDSLILKMTEHTVAPSKILLNFNKPTMDIHQSLKLGVGEEMWNTQPYQNLRRAVQSHLETSPRVQHTIQSNPDLPIDCLAALVYYTSDVRVFGGNKSDSPYILLNTALSDMDQTRKKQWEPFLYFAFGCKKFLKPWKGTVYRGIDKALTTLSDQYVHDATVVWNSFTSTSTSDSIIKHFAENAVGSWMIIDVVEGFQLPFSLFPEDEVLLFPNSSFKIMAIMTTEMKKLLKFPVGLDVIHFRQQD